MSTRKHCKGKNFLIIFVKTILIIVLFPIVLIWLFSQKRKKIDDDSIEIVNMSQIDSLSGEEFELLLKSLFENQGYNVELTKKSHDYGADLILEKGKIISIVQAKCYENNVGIRAVQEIISSKVHYNAKNAMVVINRYFSKEAINLAYEHGVELIDRDRLIELIKKFMPEINLINKKTCAMISDARNEIETKYIFWI